MTPMTVAAPDPATLPSAISGLPLVPSVKPPQLKRSCVGLKSSAVLSQLISSPCPSG